MDFSSSDSKRLAEYFIALSATSRVEEGFSLLDQRICSLGFDAVAYSAMPVSIGTQGAFQPVFLASRDYSKDFLNHYDEAGLWQHDFTIDRIERGSLTLMDWQLEARKGLPAEQQKVVDIATFEHGIKNAFTIPTQSDSHVIAGGSVLSYTDRAVFEKLAAAHMREAQQLFQLFHQYIFMRSCTASFFYKPLLDTLTDTQKRVLAFIVTGKFQKHSKEYIGISPTRTGNVLSELYDILNVRNVSQLSYLAGHHRLVDMINM